MLDVGFEGRYTNKAGKTAEGSATFFRRERYRAVALKEIKMNELFADILANPSAHCIHSQFLPLLQSSPNLVQALSRVRHTHSPPYGHRSLCVTCIWTSSTLFPRSAWEVRQVLLLADDASVHAIV